MVKPEKYPVRVDTSNIKNFVKRLKEVRQVNILDIYRRFYKHYRAKTAQRFLTAANETPFAPSSIGRRRPSGDIITNNSLYGIDTGTVFYDFTNNVKIDDGGLVVWSDAFYAKHLEANFQKKSPYAPEGVLHVDKGDLAVLERIIMEEVKEGLDDILSRKI